MHKFVVLGLLAGTGLLAGCNSTPLTTTMEPQAMQTALTRAKFEMSCPDATGQVLSQQNLQPLVQPGPWMRAGGIERAQYTIGVSGCGQKRTMVVICSQENGCFAADGQS